VGKKRSSPISASRILKFSLLTILVALIVMGAAYYDLYRRVYGANVFTGKEKEIYFFVKTGWNYDSVLTSLKDKKLLKNVNNFEWTAKKKKLSTSIKSGRYLLKNRMSNNELVNMLRVGRQSIVKLTFNNIRRVDQFAGRISHELEFDSLSFLNLIYDTSTYRKYSCNKYTVPCIFIPNTYEFYWNTTAEQFIKKMYDEYVKFWNTERLDKATKLGMTREQVITLASIVDEETKQDDEKNRVAGVYINRMKHGMRLQADPTVIFAWNNYSIHRVLTRHKEINSPYNTYRKDGLPPGPICFPAITSIDAVLDYEKHNYLYFCAKPDFSGYHNFSTTLEQHNRYARAYQIELNKRNIYR
jgi:UPF0755 protein